MFDSINFEVSTDLGLKHSASNYLGQLIISWVSKSTRQA